MKNKVNGLEIVSGACISFRKDIALHGGGPDAGQVNAGSIVRYPNLNFVPVKLTNSDGDGRPSGLADALPIRGKLDTVVDAVAEDVVKGILNFLRNALVN